MDMHNYGGHMLHGAHSFGVFSRYTEVSLEKLWDAIVGCGVLEASSTYYFNWHSLSFSCLILHWHCSLSHGINTCMEYTQFNLIRSKHAYLILFINLGSSLKKNINHFSISTHSCIVKRCHSPLLWLKNEFTCTCI